METWTLVTGGAGFIGSFLVEQLLLGGHNVRVLDSLVPQVHGASPTRPPYIPAEADVITADLRDKAAVAQAVRGVSVVIHLAAEVGPAQSLYEITRYVGGNTYATAVLLEELLLHRDHIERLIVASSMAVYGEGEYSCPNCGTIAPKLRTNDQLQQRQWEPICPTCNEELTPIPTRETKPTDPASVYGITKRDQEDLCLLFGQTYGVPTVALRFFNTYGPRQALSNPYTGVAAIFAAQLLAGKAPVIFEDGRQTRDLTHVSDIVNGIRLALGSERAIGRTLNLAAGQPRAVIDIARDVAKGLGLAIEPRILGQYRARDIRHCFADITAASACLGYQPRKAFDEGMRELTEWVRSQQRVETKKDANQELDRLKLLR